MIDILRPPAFIELGYVGEDNWSPVPFDLEAWFEKAPGGFVSIWLQPDGGQKFPVSVVVDGNIVTWTPKSAELLSGTGRLQVVYMPENATGMSAMMYYRVKDSIIGEDGDAQSEPPWAITVAQNAAKAEAAAAAAEDAADRAEEAGGDVSPEQIAEAVEDYFDEHPIDVPVNSVNGKTGIVVLDASDVGALPADTPVPAAVTEQTVAGWGFTKNTGTYSKPSTGIPISDLAQAVQTSLGKADTALQTAPVTSVNTKTGAVTLTASDVGALPSSTSIPTKVSDLTNDSGFQTAPFEIPITGSDGNYTTTATAQEIYDNAENCVIALGIYRCVPTRVQKDTSNESTNILVSVAAGINSNLYVAEIRIHAELPSTVTITVQEKGFLTLPAVTSDDNGKFLSVANGAWAAESVSFQTPRVAMTASDTTPALDPNKLYVFPEMASLAITLATPTDSNIVNEYHFIFTSGATATTLSIPATVNQPDGFSVDANMVYEVSILENNMTAMSWEVTA